MMKKFLLPAALFMLIQNICFANDIIQFSFPNEGWHKVASPDGVESKKCYVPVNQTSENYTEMLVFMQKNIKNTDISPVVILQKQLGKDKNNYSDIIPEYISSNMDDAMAAWCSKSKNICTIERAFNGSNGIVLAIYTNKAPHYSQNMFGQWPNILSGISVYNQTSSDKTLIEL